MTEPVSTFGDTIVEYSKDHREVTVLVGGEEYLAVKPKKAEEWFIEINIAMASDDSSQLLYAIEQFFAKVFGPKIHAEIRKRRLNDDDDLSWTQMSEVMKDLFEIWTTEADQPPRPTGRRSVSSRGRKPTTQK